MGTQGFRDYNGRPACSSGSLMELVDLRSYPSRALEPPFQQEIRRWRDELYWDYRPSIELIR